MAKKEEMIQALLQEIEMRKDEFKGQEVSCIYFGGGTPSVLETKEINQLIQCVYDHYTVSSDPEITLEANPDDLSRDKIQALQLSAVNRLSIGVQSFFEADLKMMNRAHNAQEAVESIILASEFFENLSLDLIYGIPGMNNIRWEQNIEKALALGVPHISAYALTVEPKTALENFIKKGVIPPVQDEVAQEHHKILVERMEAAGYENYEFSNFGKAGFHSRNNTSYWEGKSYIGIGPGAHSYNGIDRSWNISNNPKYIKSITAGVLPMEVETLSLNDRYNEYVMTRLRTAKGISLKQVQDSFGTTHHDYLLKQAQKHLKEQLLLREDGRLHISKKGKFLSDGIASDLFLVTLELT